MRDLTTNQFTAEVLDPFVGVSHEILFRSPSNQERIRYSDEVFRRMRDEGESGSDLDADIKRGADLITGIVKGTFAADGKAFASEADDPDYRSDWLDLILRAAPEIPLAICRLAYGRARAEVRKPKKAPPADESVRP